MVTFFARLIQADPADKIARGIMITLSEEASYALPSRGMAMVQGSINGVEFRTPVEPDGKGSHWFRLKDSLLDQIGAGPGQEVEVTIEPSKDWVEPAVPVDLQEALDADLKALENWQDITTAARWDWIRWIGTTRVEATRRGRIEKAISMLKSGKRRVCCFDRNQPSLTEG